MGTKGPNNPQEAAIHNPLIKIAVAKISSMPIPRPSDEQVNYKETMLSMFIELDGTSFLESEKENALIEAIESIVESTPAELLKFKSEFAQVLSLLKTEQEKRLKAPLPEAPTKGILKNKENRKKSLNQLFDLEKNTEVHFFIEEGRQLNYSTNDFREGERQKYKEKRTPDEKGNVQLKTFGNNPPLTPEAKPFKEKWLTHRALQEVEKYFEQLGEYESYNITLNQDGSYQLVAFTESEQRSTKINYSKDEMNDIVAGFLFQKQLCYVLNGDQREAKFRYYTRAYQTALDIYSPDEREIASMIAALRSLNMEISEPDKYEGVQRVFITMEQIHKVLKEHPRGFFLPLGAAYLNALEAASDPEDSMLHDFSGTALADSGDVVFEDPADKAASEFTEVDLSASDDEALPAKPKP